MDAQTLATAMGCTPSVAQRYVADFNVALRQANCTTVPRASMFCAQIGHESVGLRYMEEIASGAAYEGRRDLGNVYPGDGRRFKGRGPIQLTGRHNYGRFGQWAKSRGLVSDANYFVTNPTVVATSKWGFLAASWYWTVARPQINSLCDKGDIVGVTRAINGGTNGLADRVARWARCRALGAALLPSGGGAAPSSVGGRSPSRAHAILLGGTDMLELPAGGGEDWSRIEPIPIPSIIREHDLVIAPSHKCAVVVRSLNTWKNQAQPMRGKDVRTPGGEGDLLKRNGWEEFVIWETAGKSFVVPAGVAKIDFAYWSDAPFRIAISPRLVD